MATPLEQKLAAALETLAGQSGGEPCNCLDQGTNECDYCAAREALTEFKQANPSPPDSDYRTSVLVAKPPTVSPAFLRDLGSEPLLPKIPRRRYTAAMLAIRSFVRNNDKLVDFTGQNVHIVAQWLKSERESFIIVYDAGFDAFMITRRSKLAAAIDEFDQAAHTNGYDLAGKAEQNAYTLARRALLELLGIST